MLEFMLLRMLTGKIGEIVEGKGQKSGWYKLLTVLLWFGGEIAGFIFGMLLVGGGDDASFALPYVFGLMGAAGGAGLSYFIASQLKAPVTVDERVFD